MEVEKVPAMPNTESKGELRSFATSVPLAPALEDLFSSFSKEGGPVLSPRKGSSPKQDSKKTMTEKENVEAVPITELKGEIPVLLRRKPSLLDPPKHQHSGFEEKIAKAVEKVKAMPVVEHKAEVPSLLRRKTSLLGPPKHQDSGFHENTATEVKRAEAAPLTEPKHQPNSFAAIVPPAPASRHDSEKTVKEKEKLNAMPVTESKEKVATLQRTEKSPLGPPVHQDSGFEEMLSMFGEGKMTQDPPSLPNQIERKEQPGHQPR